MYLILVKRATFYSCKAFHHDNIPAVCMTIMILKWSWLRWSFGIHMNIGLNNTTVMGNESQWWHGMPAPKGLTFTLCQQDDAGVHGNKVTILLLDSGVYCNGVHWRVFMCQVGSVAGFFTPWWLVPHTQEIQSRVRPGLLHPPKSCAPEGFVLPGRPLGCLVPSHRGRTEPCEAGFSPALLSRVRKVKTNI